MKKLFLLTLTCILSATFAWADTSIVETYATNLSTKASTGRTSYQGRYTEWYYRNARSSSSDQLKDGTRGFWLSRTSGTSCYLESTLEGGIKNVAFNYRQFSTGDNGFNYVLNVITKVGSAASVTQKSMTWTGAADYVNTDQPYSQAVGIKANNVKLTIQNVTTQSDGTTAGGRLIVGPITITPYLLYTQKDAIVVMGQTGYIHEIIDNTENEGSVSYSSSESAVAEVNASTGEIIPHAVGEAVITATWSEGVATTYTIHVIKGVVETFNDVVQTGSSGTTGSTWAEADLCNWETKYARRGANDKMNSKQYTWLTLDGTTRGYIKTTNLEGGIKDVSFHYGQFGAEAETLLKWQISAIGTATTSDMIERDGDLGENRSYSRGAYYTHTFNCAENAQLEIKNMSVKDDESQPTSNARLLVGDIYITPYLLYTTKAATLDTRNGLTYTNAGLINNTTGDAVVYSIAPEGNGVSINAATGEVTAESDEVEGNFEVTATWGSVTTTYTLTVTSRTATTASYPNAKVEVELNGTIDNALAYTAGYDGTIDYASSNTAVADFEAGVLTIKGVGETTITATLPQTDNYKAAEASYELYVEDNSASVQVEAFSLVSTGGAGTHAGKLWKGDLYDWRVSSCGGVRKNNDVFASDQTRGGIWMGTPDPNTNYGSLTAENGVEGGIKHLWFYVEQPYNTGETGYTLKPVVYLDAAVAANKVGEVEVVGASGANNIAANRRLFGASNVAKSNSVLIIQNESYLTEDGTRPSGSRGRLLLDEIHITPYLLYTTKEAEMDMRIATTFTNNDLINNTESGSITYSLENNDEEATIDAASGEVTALKAGEVTVKATWSEGAYTTYTLTIISITETEAAYAEPEQHMILGADVPENELTTNYGGTIAYASSNTAVADYVGGVLTVTGVGQTKITATMEANDDYTAASASYILTVSYSNYESFEANVTTGSYVKPEEHVAGDQCEWYAYVGGIQTPNYFSSNAITTRAPRTGENQGYVKSAKLSGGISALAFNYSMMFAETDIENWDIHIYVNDRLVGQLTNEAGGELEGINGRTLNPMRTKVIIGIDEPGMFVIRFENHSTIKEGVEYTSGNKGRFAIDNVSWESYGEPIVLNENVDNSAVLAVNSGSVQDVTIIRSPLQGGKWNTLCLPFDLYKTEIGASANVQELSTTVLEGEVLTVGFKALEGDVLKAGTPYLINPESTVDLSKTYNNRQITSVASPVVREVMTLQGVFSPYAMTAGDTNTFFVGEPKNGNNLFNPSVNGDMKGFRAYFKLNLQPGQQAPKRARFVVDQEEVATEIMNVQSDNVPCTKVMENGVLYLMYKGTKYNVQGARVQ